jgi:hypothetical protein
MVANMAIGRTTVGLRSHDVRFGLGGAKKRANLTNRPRSGP